MSEKRDWNKKYKERQTPWDTGLPSSELKGVIENSIVKPCRALDLGCGTGTNAIYLAQKGFDVTAVDISDVAIKMAKEKAKNAGVKVDFIKAAIPDCDMLVPASFKQGKGKQFDFVFDRGFFHAIDDNDRPRYAEMLEQLTGKDSILLLLCGNAKEPREDGPPTLTEEEVRESFSRLYDFIHLRDLRFDWIDPKQQGPLGYSCLMKRKKSSL